MDFIQAMIPGYGPSDQTPDLSTPEGMNQFTEANSNYLEATVPVPLATEKTEILAEGASDTGGKVLKQVCPTCAGKQPQAEGTTELPSDPGDDIPEATTTVQGLDFQDEGKFWDMAK
jgi:hypothetical protein